MGKHVALTTDRTIISWLTPTVRQWLYGVLTVAVPLLIAYGVLDAERAALWVALGGAVLGLGTATAHTGGTYPAPVEGADGQ